MESSVGMSTTTTEPISFKTRTYVITRAPREWLRASLLKHQAFLKTVKDCGSDPFTALEREQAERWEKQTGVKPEETHFTVIVPVHNEEKFLPSFLGSILLVDIPARADAHILFLTNACSDRSREIIDEFLKSVGEGPASFSLKNSPDAHVTPTGLTTHRGSITFSRVDTATPGKANALNIGNTLALEWQHRIVLSVDANNFIEPDVLRHMFARAYHAFTDPANTTVVVSGIMENVTTRTRLRVLFDRGRRAHNYARNNKTFVNGWCMGWDSRWLQSIGGMPQLAVEDYALGVYARHEGKRTEPVPEAKIWGYNPNNLADLIEQRARKIRGAYQLLGVRPALRQAIESDIYVLQRPLAKITTVIQRVRANPAAFLYHLADLLIWELAKQKGSYDYRKDPTNQSWKPINSTKAIV